MNGGFVRLPADGIGKLIDAAAVIVPKGTPITAADGSVSELAADTVYYRQSVALADPNSPSSFAAVAGESGKGALAVADSSLETLKELNEHLLDIKFMLAAALDK